MTAHPRFPISGPQLAGALIAIVVATAVLPPGAAWLLNARRITQTQTRAGSAAEYLRAHPERVAGATITVACGPGRLPQLVPATASARAAARSLASHGDWILGATLAPELFGEGMPTDAWGRCFLLNVRAQGSAGPAWLLSAGPNGLIETPMGALALGGDDIGARVR
jgi:hypothetical protein